MHDFVMILRDPMVRTILAVVAICLTVLFFLVGRRRKALGYMLSDTRVLGVHEAVNPSRVEILFDGEPVTDVHLVIITIKNLGNEPIRVDDFERALRFSWAEPAKLLTAVIAEVSPESLQPTIKTGVNEIVLDPLLLNPGDWFRVRTLINQAGRLSVDARIVGVKRISKTVTSGTVTSPRTLRLVAALGAAGTGLMLVGRMFGLWEANGRVDVRITQAVVLGMLFLLADELKRSVLSLGDYYREKKDARRSTPRRP